MKILKNRGCGSISIGFKIKAYSSSNIISTSSSAPNNEAIIAEMNPAMNGG